MIQKDAVLQVAQSLGLFPTDAQIEQIIEEHEGYCESDPTGTWNLVVEQQLYEFDSMGQEISVDVTTSLKITKQVGVSLSEVIQEMDYNFTSKTEGAKITNTEIKEFKKGWRE